MIQTLKYSLILFVAQSFILISALFPHNSLAQTSNSTSASAVSFYSKGNMMEANMQYGALLSVEPGNTDYSYYYAVTCTADSALRQDGIDRLKALEGLISLEGERLFFLALAHQHSSNFKQAIKIFERAVMNADKKSDWLLEANFRLSQCRFALENHTSISTSVLSFSRLSSLTVSLHDFFRSIPTKGTPFRMVILPTELRTKLDKKMGYVSSVAFDAEADLMYFSSYGKKGATGLDIYSAEILQDGSLSIPKRLPESVNSTYDEINPFMHSDSSLLIFSSNRPSSLGGYDIFSSEAMSSSGPYLDCEVYESGVNSPLNEFAFYPFGDVSRGWLVSDKSGYFSSVILSEIEINVEVESHQSVPEELVQVVEIEQVVEVELPTSPSRIIENTSLVSSYNLSIQLGVFSNKPNRSQLPTGFEMFTLVLPNGLYKVFAGPYKDEIERSQKKQMLIELGFMDVFNVEAKPQSN